MTDFERIYQDYFADVYRYALSLTLDEHRAEDITAEVFLRAMRSLSSFRGECEIRIWLCKIAKNLCRTQQRKQTHHADAPPDENTADPYDFTEALADHDTALSIHRLLHRMPEPYKEVFSLRTFGEMSFRDIGSLFEKSEHWACVTYHRAKEKLRGELKKQEEECK